MADFGGDEEHRAGVFAGGDAGATADALRGVHREIGVAFRNGQGVGVGRGTRAGGDEAAGLLDFVEGGAVGDEVFNDGEGTGAEGLDDDGVTVVEGAHVGLAGGDAFAGTVGFAVDGAGAGAADAFAAVVGKGDGFDALGGELVVYDVEHL